jgi:hypothetical protein
MNEIIMRGEDAEIISGEPLDTTFVRRLAIAERTDVRAEKSLYRLSRPMPYGNRWSDNQEDGEVVATTQYVVVSALAALTDTFYLDGAMSSLNASMSRPETMVFAADEAGEVIDWTDMACVRAFDPQAALRDMGVGAIL